MTFEIWIIVGANVISLFINLHTSYLNNDSRKMYNEMRDAYEELAEELVEMQNACGEFISGMIENERNNNTRQ